MALQRGLQLHGGCTLQAQLCLIAAIGIAQAAHVQLVFLAGVAVQGIQCMDFYLWRAFPDELLDMYGQINAHGQLQRLQGLGGCFILGAWRALDAQLLHVHLAKMHGARQQGRQLPADICLGDFHLHGGAAPSQPVNLPAVAQRALHTACFQLLVCGQPALYIFEGALQRLALT